MPKKIYFLLVFLFLATSAAFFVLKGQPKEIVYVDSQKLFNGFSMTRELQKEGEKEVKKLKSTLDSIQSILALRPEDADRVLLVNEAISKRQEIEAFQQSFEGKNSEKIWGRIKTYTADFAQKNKYKLIIGSQYEGDVLYGEKSLDVTIDMLNFINSKYEGL